MTYKTKYKLAINEDNIDEWCKDVGSGPAPDNKVVINTCYGEFNLSSEARWELFENYGWSEEQIESTKDHTNEVIRSDRELVEVVEKLGERANGHFSKLKVVTLPDEPKLLWMIEHHKGFELIHELHRTWF